MLLSRPGRARIIAGGTDLMRDFQQGEHRADCLVDITRISALHGIAVAGDVITIGATTTHAGLARSPVIRKHALVLAEAAAEVGSPQVRNTGTIGGNVVNAQPAADTALALLALDAEAEILSSRGARWLPVAELYAGPGESRVDSTCELLCRFRFRALQGQAGSAYRRLNRRKTIALPSLCAAVVVRLRDSAFQSAAIAVGPVASKPWRASAAECWLRDKPADEKSVAHAADIAQREAEPRDSLLRGSRTYRKAMVAVLVEHTLQRALEAAKRGEQCPN